MVEMFRIQPEILFLFTIFVAYFLVTVANPVLFQGCGFN